MGRQQQEEEGEEEEKLVVVAHKRRLLSSDAIVGKVWKGAIGTIAGWISTNQFVCTLSPPLPPPLQVSPNNPINSNVCSGIWNDTPRCEAARKNLYLETCTAD